MPNLEDKKSEPSVPRGTGQEAWEKVFKAMTKLDNSIPDWAFDSEQGEKMQKAIDNVYECIAEAREVQDA